MLIGYNDSDDNGYVLQYNVDKNNLELVDEGKKIKVGYKNKIAKLNEGRLIITDFFDGTLLEYS